MIGLYSVPTAIVSNITNFMIQTAIGSVSANMTVVQASGLNTFVEYDFGNIFSAMPSFDRVPLGISVILDKRFSGYEDFTAYASANYCVQVITPNATGNYPAAYVDYYWPTTGEVNLPTTALYIN